MQPSTQHHSRPEVKHNTMLITSNELAQRWRLSPLHIARMRQQGDGPAYLRIGYRTVRYRLEDVIEFERARLMAAV